MPILTTVHPIALAELRQRVWFSFLSHGFMAPFVFITRSSMVPGTATFISLLKEASKISSRYIEHPQQQSLNYWIVKQNVRHLPEKDSIFHEIEQRICRRINWKMFLQELIFCQVVIDVGNVGCLLGLIDIVAKSCCGCLEKGNRVFQLLPTCLFCSCTLQI